MTDFDPTTNRIPFGLLTENIVVTYAPFKQSERWNNND